MKLRSLVLAFVLCMPAATGCGEDGPEAFPTYQECFDDRAVDNAVPVKEAIVVCCTDHAIAGVKPVCMGTRADCINYLTAGNLDQTSASTTDVQEACDDYIAQLGM